MHVIHILSELVSVIGVHFNSMPQLADPIRACGNAYAQLMNIYMEGYGLVHLGMTEEQSFRERASLQYRVKSNINIIFRVSNIYFWNTV